jgi:site-specific DNA-methyltransferase (adenine-specific)
MILGPYEIDNIYTGECSAMMAEMPDNCIDLTVTSPPYDNVDENMVTHSGKGLRDYQGYEWDFVSVAKELWRVTKVGGVVVWVVGDATVNGSETGSSFRQALYFKEVGFRLADTMIYQKISPFPIKSLYHQAFQFMFLLSKEYINCFNPIFEKRDIESSKRISSSRRTSLTSRNKDGILKQLDKSGLNRMNSRDPENRKKINIWKIDAASGQSTKDKIAYQHPAIFPEALARDHIISWSNPGAIVLDPFMGSGTVAKMAIEQGRHYLGFDISQEYVDLAERRVKGARVPLGLEL